jgi:hypothetical protein
MAEMDGTVERAFSIREVVNAASNVVTTVSTAVFRAGQQIASWAITAMEDSQHSIAKDQEVFEFL